MIRERARPDVRIYSDEVYEHILFDGESHNSIWVEPGMEERTVLVSGHSKGFAMTGWRLGWAVLPTAEEAAVFKNLNINLVSCVPPFIQEAGREAYESDGDPGLGARRWSRRSSAGATGWSTALNDIDGITCRHAEGRLLRLSQRRRSLRQSLGVLEAYDRLSPESRTRTSPSGMLQLYLLYSFGVATMDRPSFGAIGAEGKHFLRLSIATSMERLQEGVGRMKTATADREAFARFLTDERLWD